MLCEAIKTLSGNVSTGRIYGHIGWRLINEEWVYLHAGGAIGANGLVNTKLLDLNVQLAAAAWRAPLIEFCPTDFGLFDVGATGTLKSALTGVARAFWARGGMAHTSRATGLAPPTP